MGMRAYNPVRELILKKLEEYRVEMEGDEIRRRTNLEALVDVIFDRAIEQRGRVPIEAARLLFEYAVGKPNQTLEVTTERRVARTRDEIEAELAEASKALGLDGFKYEMVEEYHGDRPPVEAKIRDRDGAAVPVARRAIEASTGAEEGDRAVGAQGSEEDTEDDLF